VDKSGFGWGGAGTGVGIYDYVNNSFWLQQGGTTQNKILTGNNTLDDGSGNMTVNGNSITALVVNSSSAAANSISLQYNSGTQGLYLKYDSVGGIQILDATAMVWLGQGGLTAHAVKTFTNTLDDGSGGFIAGPSGAATIALGNATGPATINLLGAINLNNTGTLASAINFGTSSNYSGTITIGNTAALAKVGVNALTPVAVNTTTLGTSALPFISLCLGTSSTAYGIKKIVQVTLSQSQIQNMFSTPVQVAAAPGGGLAIFVQTCTVNYVAGTAAFSVGGVIVVQYGNTASGGGVTATNGANVAGAGLLNAGTTNKYVVAIGVNNAAGSVGVASSGVINTGIFISNQTAAFNNSGSGATLVVTLEYLIVPMS
jgi:hypothetical protein